MLLVERCESSPISMKQITVMISGSYLIGWLSFQLKYERFIYGRQSFLVKGILEEFNVLKRPYKEVFRWSAKFMDERLQLLDRLLRHPGTTRHKVKTITSGNDLVDVLYQSLQLLVRDRLMLSA